MKSFIENGMDATSVLFRLFLAAICLQVNNNLAVLMITFYILNTVFSVYYLHLKAKEEEQFLIAVKKAIEKEVNNGDENELD